MSLLGDLSGSSSAMGSVSNSNNGGYSVSTGRSNTNATAANENAIEAARVAFERQKELMQMQMEYNSREAQKERDYQTQMANSIYTRSVQNMKEAGINPILAANMGLSAASVGSGATASISGSSAPMAQSFMDTNSAQSSKAQNWGESHGSSWGSSESGLATGLKLMGEALGQAIQAVNSSHKIDIALQGFDNKVKETWDDIKASLPSRTQKAFGITHSKSDKGIKNKIKQKSSGGGKKF